MCSISVEPIPSTIRMPVFSNHASDTPAGSGSPADTHVCSESRHGSSLEQRAVRGRRGEQRRHLLLARSRRAAVRRRASARCDAPKRSGNSSEAAEPERERERRRAAEDVGRLRVAARGARTCRTIASRSRWRCTQPFGSPVVPAVKAMIATSSAAVSHGVERSRASAGPRSRARPCTLPTSPARSRATSACVTCALADDLLDLAARAAAASSPRRSRPRAGSRARPRSPPACWASAAARASPRLDVQRAARPRPRARAARRSDHADPCDRRALVREQLARPRSGAPGTSSSSRSGHASRGGRRSRANVSISR